MVYTLNIFQKWEAVKKANLVESDGDELVFKMSREDNLSEKKKKIA